MFENELKNYFEKKIDAKQLKAAMDLSLKGAVSRTRDSSFGNEFELYADHLIQVCDDVLAGHLAPEYVESIGVELTSSDQFIFEDSESGERAKETAFQWDCCEVRYRFTPETIQKFKIRLQTGEDLLTEDDLAHDE